MLIILFNSVDPKYYCVNIHKYKNVARIYVLYFTLSSKSRVQSILIAYLNMNSVPPSGSRLWCWKAQLCGQSFHSSPPI